MHHNDTSSALLYSPSTLTTVWLKSILTPFTWHHQSGLVTNIDIRVQEGASIFPAMVRMLNEPLISSGGSSDLPIYHNTPLAPFYLYCHWSCSTIVYPNYSMLEYISGSGRISGGNGHFGLEPSHQSEGYLLKTSPVQSHHSCCVTHRITPALCVLCEMSPSTVPRVSSIPYPLVKCLYLMLRDHHKFNLWRLTQGFSHLCCLLQAGAVQCSQLFHQWICQQSHEKEIWEKASSLPWQQLMPQWPIC